jgi:hypothetical protein
MLLLGLVEVQGAGEGEGVEDAVGGAGEVSQARVLRRKFAYKILPATEDLSDASRPVAVAQQRG